MVEEFRVPIDAIKNDILPDELAGKWNELFLQVLDTCLQNNQM